jgi:putative toxin-antitoxin system antitoxin component (TIGR02293 family)
MTAKYPGSYISAGRPASPDGAGDERGAVRHIGDNALAPTSFVAETGAADERRYGGVAEAAAARYAAFPSDADPAMSDGVHEVPFIGRICAKLGLPPLDSEMELLMRVEQGLSVDSVRALAGNGASQVEIYDLVIPRRTLDHRTANRQPLTCEESDKLVRLARVVALAEAVFGDAGKAERWLRKPKVRLGDSSPMQRLATDMGARLVEEMLQQIDHGIAA